MYSKKNNYDENKHKFFHVRFNKNFVDDEIQDSSMAPKGDWKTMESREHSWVSSILHNTPNILNAVYQLERGSAGIHHWQLTIEFGNPVNKYAVKRLFRIQKNETYYIEKCRTSQGSAIYCNKSATRLEGPFDYHKSDIIDQLTRIAVADSVKSTANVSRQEVADAL